jgi:hypothetical protein
MRNTRGVSAADIGTDPNPQVAVRAGGWCGDKCPCRFEMIEVLLGLIALPTRTPVE